MTAQRTRELLERHVGHRTVIRDGRTLRCVDCAHTLLLDQGTATLTADDQAEHVTATPSSLAVTVDQDSYGRRPCVRCDRYVTHLYANDLPEPVPHAGRDGQPCRAAGDAPRAQMPLGGWRSLVDAAKADA